MKNLAPRLVLYAIALPAVCVPLLNAQTIAWGEAKTEAYWLRLYFTDLNGEDQLRLRIPRPFLLDDNDNPRPAGAEVPIYRVKEENSVNGVKIYSAQKSYFVAVMPPSENKDETRVSFTVTQPGTKFQRTFAAHKNAEQGDWMIVNRPQLDPEKAPLAPFAELEALGATDGARHYYGGHSAQKASAERFLPPELILDPERAGYSLPTGVDSKLTVAINLGEPGKARELVKRLREDDIAKDIQTLFDETKKLREQKDHALKFSRPEAVLLFGIADDASAAANGNGLTRFQEFFKQLREAVKNDAALTEFVAKWRTFLLSEMVLCLEEAARDPAKSGNPIDYGAALDAAAARFNKFVGGDAGEMKLAAARADTGRTPSPAGVKDGPTVRDPFRDD